MVTNFYSLITYCGFDPKIKLKEKFKPVVKREQRRGFEDIGFDKWNPEEGNDYGDQQEEKRKTA